MEEREAPWSVANVWAHVAVVERRLRIAQIRLKIKMMTETSGLLMSPLLLKSQGWLAGSPLALPPRCRQAARPLHSSCPPVRRQQLHSRNRKLKPAANVTSPAAIVHRLCRPYIALADRRLLALLVANGLQHLTAGPRVHKAFSVNLMQNGALLQQGVKQHFAGGDLCGGSERGVGE